MSYSDDPVSDFNSHDAEQEELLKSKPICKCCREHIQQDSAVCIDGDYYCDICLDDKREYI